MCLGQKLRRHGGLSSPDLSPGGTISSAGSRFDSTESLKPEISKVTLIYPRTLNEHAWCFHNTHQEVDSGQPGMRLETAHMKMCFKRSYIFCIEFYLTNKGKELVYPLRKEIPLTPQKLSC